MRLRLKSRAIITIIALLVICVGGSMVIHYRLMKREAVALKNAEIDAAFDRYLTDINAFTDHQGQKAAALANLGAWVYEVEKQNPSFDAPNAAMKVALSQLSTPGDQPLLGGGIWYEPYALEPDKKWVGPYAVVDGPGRAKPNWEYSTDKYAYSTHRWYTIAVPKDWDRSRERLKDLYMTEPYMDSLGGRPTVFITFTHVMYAPNRRIIGVTTADWTFDSLRTTLSAFRGTPSSFAVMVHAPSNKVLFPADRDELSLLSDTGWGKHIDVDKATVGSVVRQPGVRFGGRTYDLMYTRTHAGFVFGHFVDTSEAYGFLRDIQLKNLAIAIATLLLLAFATFIAVSRLIGPIDRLAESARLIAAGDREHEAPVEKDDEIGALAEAFNRSHRNERRYAAQLEETADKLRASEEHFRALIENSADIIAVVDAETSVRYMSPSAWRVLGVDTDALVGKPLQGLVSERDTPSLTRAVTRLADRRSPVESLELEVRHADGSWRCLECVCTRHPDGFVINARDVTARRDAEEALHRSEAQLRQVAKLEAVGRLAGGIAHDFNNAMTAVLGTTQLLQRRHRDNPKLAASLTDIREAAEHASALTRQLLTFSRHKVAERRAVDLNEAVLGVERMLTRLIGADVTLETDLAGDMRPVLGDVRELEQILVNLVVNARDALPDGGRITVQTRLEQLSAPLMSVTGRLDPGEYCVLAVIDDGIGIDEATLPKIFDPFFTTKPAEQGTGLGLSTVYGIVQDSRGYILVDSDHNGGTRFQIYWRSTSQAADRDATGEHAAPRGHARVLLVEDDPRVRNVTAETLREAGMTVVEAGDGTEALAQVRDGTQVDIIVTDVVMPRMKGPELAAEVATFRPDLPIIFVSGYVAGELDEDLLEEPHYAYLQKPYEHDQLIELISDQVKAAHRRRPTSDPGLRPGE